MFESQINVFPQTYNFLESSYSDNERFPEMQSENMFDLTNEIGEAAINNELLRYWLAFKLQITVFQQN